MGPAIGLLYKYVGDSLWEVMLLLSILIFIFLFFIEENKTDKLKYAMYILLCIIGLVVLLFL